MLFRSKESSSFRRYRSQLLGKSSDGISKKELSKKLPKNENDQNFRSISIQNSAMICFFSNEPCNDFGGVGGRPSIIFSFLDNMVRFDGFVVTFTFFFFFFVIIDHCVTCTCNTVLHNLISTSVPRILYTVMPHVFVG